MQKLQRSLLVGAVSTMNRSFSRTTKYPRPLKTKKHGIDILHDPLWNKSLAFSLSERDRLGLRGLLPPAVRSLESQVERTIRHIRSEKTAIEKNIYLQGLHNRNETLYHRVLVDHIEELAPLVYTPTVGTVCEQFGFRFQRARGMYFSAQDKGQFATMVHNWPHDDVHVIVVTDGSRILGLGDLGAHGMGIPIGKLALYCAAGGIAPHRVLPITIDVGTNNEKLLNDESYVGLRQRRLDGEAYFEVIEEFMQAIFSRWHDVVVQFEDFETAKAVPILEKYRHTYRCFNDDIQGTGCVTLAGVLSAIDIAGHKSIIDPEVRILCVGAGSAGLGVCAQLLEGMKEAGLSEAEARAKFVLCTIEGAIGAADGSHGNPHHQNNALSALVGKWANPVVPDGVTAVEALKKFKPTVILGLTACKGAFTEEMIRTMTTDCLAVNRRPIVIPMSNPTDKCECTAEEAYTWSNGTAIVATGSPFGPVTLPNGKTYVPSQCNNMYIFPGLGLAASVAGITTFTDKMLYVAATACAKTLTPAEKEMGRTFTHISNIREVSLKVASAVIEEGWKAGLTKKITEKHIKEGIANLVRRKMYFPEYVPLLSNT